MVLLHPKWRMEITEETEIEEDPDRTVIRSRVIMRHTGRQFFTLELYYCGDLVFKMRTGRPDDQEPQLFIKMLDGKLPLELLLEEANK